MSPDYMLLSRPKMQAWAFYPYSTWPPAAYLASLRNLLTEFTIINSDSVDINNILQAWTFELTAKRNWDRYHLLIR